MKKFVVLSVLSVSKNTDNQPLFLQNSVPMNVSGFIADKTIRQFPKPFKLVKTKSTDVVTLIPRCPSNSWVVVIDCNVILPHNFWDTLQIECTDPTKVYGVNVERYHSIKDHACNVPIVNIFATKENTATESPVRVFFYNKITQKLPNITSLLPITVAVIEA